MESTTLAVNEGRIEQRVGESLSYGITTTPWGSAPESITIVAVDMTDPLSPQTVTSTVIPGSASAGGDIITLPKLGGLTVGHTYRIRVTFTDAETNVFVVVFYVLAVP